MEQSQAESRAQEMIEMFKSQITRYYVVGHETMRLISIKWSGETLSDVTLPPQLPQPSVILGGRLVDRPIAP